MRSRPTDALAFAPQNANTRVGDIVEWDNPETVQHNITFNGGAVASLNDNALNAGGKWQARFSAAGTYSYQCTLHGGMTGAVAVH